MNVRASAGSSAAPPTTASRSRPPSFARIGRRDQRRAAPATTSGRAATRRPARRGSRARHSASKSRRLQRRLGERAVDARGEALEDPRHREHDGRRLCREIIGDAARSPRANTTCRAERQAAGSSRRCARTCATAAASTGSGPSGAPSASRGSRRRWRGCCRATASRPSAGPRYPTCSRSSPASSSGSGRHLDLAARGRQEVVRRRRRRRPRRAPRRHAARPSAASAGDGAGFAQAAREPHVLDDDELRFGIRRRTTRRSRHCRRRRAARRRGASPSAARSTATHDGPLRAHSDDAIAGDEPLAPERRLPARDVDRELAGRHIAPRAIRSNGDRGPCRGCARCCAKRSAMLGMAGALAILPPSAAVVHARMRVRRRAFAILAADGGDAHGHDRDRQEAPPLARRRRRKPRRRSPTISRKRFDLECAWNGDDIEFERPGVTGQLHVGKSEVRLDCQLGFLLSMLKPTIEDVVHRDFDKYFGKAAQGLRPKSQAKR